MYLENSGKKLETCEDAGREFDVRFDIRALAYGSLGR
jgi:hypothetical protein